MNAIISRPLPDEFADHGFVLEVDLFVPAEMHDRFADLPPAPFSETPLGSKQRKLLLTLASKQHYVIHSAFLKFYVEVLGVKVDCVHRAVGFSQELIFESYVAKNTDMRARSSYKFKKDYYKLKITPCMVKPWKIGEREKTFVCAQTEHLCLSLQSRLSADQSSSKRTS